MVVAVRGRVVRGTQAVRMVAPVFTRLVSLAPLPIEPAVRPRPAYVICPRCGGRLFLETEYLGRRLSYYWNCVNCARNYTLAGISEAVTAYEYVSRQGR